MRLPPRVPAPGSSSALPAWPPVHTARGPGGVTGAHAHHAMHLVLSHGPPLRIDVGARRYRAPGVLTAPDAEHAIDARGAQVTLVFVDPESDVGERLRATLRGGPTRLLTSAERDSLLETDEAAEDARSRRSGGGGAAAPSAPSARTAWTAWATWTDLIMHALGAEPAPRRRVHPRVRKLLAHLGALPPSADTSLEALAAAVNLSPGRLMHVFTASVGIPLRPYLAWLRLQRAAAAVVSGLPLSQAAAMAGFTDAAHMTRSFRAMFGTTPSSLRREGAASSYKRA